MDKKEKIRKDMILTKEAAIELMDNNGTLNIHGLISGLEYTSIECLPDGLIKLDCSYNKLETLPELPDSLEILECHNNKLKIIPKLPNNLVVLSCRINELEELPLLPINLFELDCGYNMKLPNYYSEWHFDHKNRMNIIRNKQLIELRKRKINGLD
jgi:Leucine-rich repeat (LRR) protein